MVWDEQKEDSVLIGVKNQLFGLSYRYYLRAKVLLTAHYQL